MTIPSCGYRPRPAARLITILVLLASTGFMAGNAFAQAVRLTAAQQQMLNSLPAAQRQQALNAIRQLQGQSADTAPATLNETETTVAPAAIADTLQPVIADLEPRAAAQSRLVINFRPRASLSAADREDLQQDPTLGRLVGSHLFVLDDAGVLALPGLDPIPLLGLDRDDIKRRLDAESALVVFDIDAKILGQEPIGVEALEPFGYAVFDPRETGFEPPATGPVPADYVLGPGDAVRVQLFGNVNQIYEFEVSRDGILNLPEIGPITVAGIPFSEFRSDLDKRVANMLIGTQVSVTMGALKTIRVFVLGDANEPGSYVVSGLATISSALYRSGGISRVGSLRNVQLKRGGKVVARLDLYDLLINGDTSGDQRLQPGDVIFVPPVGDTVAVGGAVKRPAIYEITDGTAVADIVRLAGGLSNEAYGAGARLERIDEQGNRTVVAVDLGDRRAASMRARTGDTLLVPEVLPDFGNAVELSGHVHRQGIYAWREGLRLADVISSPDELKAGVDMHYVLVRRERERGKPIEVLATDLAAALSNPGGEANIPLEPRDRIYVFSLELGRQRIVEPIVAELRQQATHDTPALQVEISGEVRAQGVYPLESGMRVSDLIRAGGRLSEDAYALEAELIRYSVEGGQSRVLEERKIDLAAVQRGDRAADIELRPYDYLRISKIPEWDTIWTVSLDGEVRFPGQYRVRRGETLAEVLRRAGGLTDAAFPEGAVFLRESLKKREQEQIELLARRLESDLTSLSLQMSDSGGSDTLMTGRALLDQLRNTEPVGRLVIDASHLATFAGSDRNTTANIELRDGDQLLVPARSQVVTVIGETQQNTSHLYLPDLTRDDYINLSGGLTRRADKRRIYIVRANGAVVVGKRSRWLGRGARADIRPGDTIVVPLDADKMRPLTFWTNVTQILYQGAIAIAAVRTFD